jgi:hypothetical protein
LRYLRQLRTLVPVERVSAHAGLNNSTNAELVLKSNPRERIMPKKLKKLDELFHDVLRDIYFAEKKILVALPKMAKAAESEELANAFKEHEMQTKEQVTRLEKVFQLIDETPRGKNCPAITGIIDEGEEIIDEYEDSPALDGPRRLSSITKSPATAP